jgi:hypothetical protein
MSAALSTVAGLLLVVSHVTPEPPAQVQLLVELIRVPRGAGEAHEISA